MASNVCQAQYPPRQIQHILNPRFLSSMASYDVASKSCEAFGGGAAGRADAHQGRAVQVDLIKATVKAPGTQRLKLKHDETPSSFCFKFKLRRYIKKLFMLLEMARHGGEVG